MQAARPVGASSRLSCLRYHRAVSRTTTSNRRLLSISASTFLVMDRSIGLFPVTAFTSFPFSLSV